jgi:hypothetical protein
MPKLSEIFPSRYLKAGVDVTEDEDLTVVIKSVEFEEFEENGRKTSKPVLYFKGQAKGMVVNKTNAGTIAALYGDDTDDWEGRAITLCCMEVQGPNGMVDSIRVKKKMPKMPALGGKPKADPTDLKAMPAAQAVDDDDDPPPF